MPRVLRGLAAAGCSAALAVAAHAAAGGGLPSTGLTVVGTALLGGAGVALADRRRGPLAILAALGAGQLGMHVVLGLGHAHQPGAGHADPVAMTALHAAAVLVVAMLLAGAENAAFAVAAVLGWLLGGPLRVSGPAPAAAPVLAVLPAAPSLVTSILLRRVHGRRGPPCRLS